MLSFPQGEEYELNYAKVVVLSTTIKRKFNTLCEIKAKLN